MARVINTEISPYVILNLKVHHTDGSIDAKSFKIDDMVGDFRYAKDGQIQKVSGRVADITYTIANTKRFYPNIMRLKSYTKYDIIAQSIVIDDSTENHSSLHEIPVREILEDQGVENVKRITYYLSYGYRAVITMSDNTVNKYDIREGQIASNILYMYKGDEQLISEAKVVAIKRPTGKFEPSVLEMNVGGRLKEVRVEQVLRIDSITSPVESTESIKDAIASATTGEVALSEGTFTESLIIDKDIKIKGAKAGISAAKSMNRNWTTLADETILDGLIEVSSEANITLDGVALTGDAYLSLGKAASVDLKNCVITGLKATAAKEYFMRMDSSSPCKVNIENCYFGAYKGAGKVYNLFEMQGKLQPGSVISGNYFAKGCCSNNAINIYEVENGSSIQIENNIWEYAANGIRIGTRGDATCTINITNNEYKATDESNEGLYAGLVLIQPYSNKTTSMRNVTVNIRGTKHYDKFHIYYMFFAGKDMPLTIETAPTVTLNGITQKPLSNLIEG